MTMIAGFSQPYQPKRLSQAAYSLHAACPACRSESSVRVKTIFTLLNELLQMPTVPWPDPHQTFPAKDS